MREILFRGKRIDNGEWVYGSPIFQDNYVLIRFWNSEEFEYEEYLVAPETVSEFTSLTDKNGKKIFEGDIVCLRTSRPHEIKYIDGRFIIDGTSISIKYANKFEVIGNIHDNPELLKEGEENGI